MVPSGWEITNFGQLAEFRNGLNFTKADQGEAIKIVGVSDFKDHSSLKNLDNLDIINVSNAVKENDLIKSGDVLYVRSNGNKDLIGRCLFFPEVTEKLSFSGFTIRGRVASEDILPDYLAILSRSEIVKQQFSKNGGGTNISNLSQQILNDVVIPLPPLSEQRKIAKILSTWDKAISTTEKLIETSKQQKKALMQQLLTGKKRLINPETGKAFEGKWEDKYLNTFAKVIVSPVDKKTVDGEVPVELCNYTDVYYNTNITRKLTFMKATAKQSEIDKFTLEVDDVIITKDSETPGDIAVPALVSEELNGVVCGYHLAIVRTDKQQADGAFINYLFDMQKTRYYFFTLATGATRFGLSVGGINKAHFCLPPLAEQQKIASALTVADKEIEVLEAKLAHFKQEKKALMQQLLTGKRRVVVDAA